MPINEWFRSKGHSVTPILRPLLRPLEERLLISRRKNYFLVFPALSNGTISNGMILILLVML